MTALLDYLASPQAVEDVRALAVYEPIFDGNSKTGYWMRAPEGVWTRISLRWDIDGEVIERRVYFRPDGEHFIVTDLGESVRALRLRTGALDVEHLAEAVARDATWLDEYERPGGVSLSPGDVLRTLNHCEPDPDRRDNVSAEALPRAICCLLAASVRVASLEG